MVAAPGPPGRAVGWSVRTAKLPDRCGSCPTSDFGSGRDPEGVWLVALAMQPEHAVDQVLHRAALLREGGEVTQVPLAGREIFGWVCRLHALVTGDDGLRVQGGDRVDAGDPGLALRLIRLVHHHVHVVVDHITADNGGGRRHVKDRRILNVTLADMNQV